MPKTLLMTWPIRARIAAVLMLATALTGCHVLTPQTNAAGATDATLCRVWGESLPTRSRSDTPQTAAEIGDAYADFAAACPAFKTLIP